MSNYQQVVTVGAAYPAISAPDVTIPFVEDQIDLIAENGTAADISFDGVNDHDRVPGNGTVIIRTKNKRIWMKGAGASIRVKARTDV